MVGNGFNFLIYPNYKFYSLSFYHLMIFQSFNKTEQVKSKKFTNDIIIIKYFERCLTHGIYNVSNNIPLLIC